MRDPFVIASIILMVLLAIVSTAFPEAPAALLIVVVLTTAFVFIFRRFTDDSGFITKVFLVSLLVRLVFGLIVHIFELRDFFGGDALGYDINGARLAEIWHGQNLSGDESNFRYVRTIGAGWGMNYLVGGIYYIVGRNILAAQSFCAVFGAAIAPMVYFCARNIYGSIRVAKMAAIAIAIFPAFVLWTSQLLKDGLIIFLLVLIMTMVMELQEKFDYRAILIMAVSLFGILSLRFYIFYIVAVAVVGTLVVGISNSPQAIIRRTVALVGVGLALLYFGVTRNINSEVETYGTLERVQLSRLDLTRSAKSGFGEDVDVSTAGGALAVIPIGFLYLMFAPFPWQASNLRQSITIPETILWWALFPMAISGLWYTLRYKWRNAFPILLFSLMLTIAYSVFQGNVGTAYRQRTQIQVFLFIFIAVGWAIFLEKRADRELLKKEHRRRIDLGPRPILPRP